MLAARAKKRAKIFRFRAAKARVREKSLSIFLLFLIVKLVVNLFCCFVCFFLSLTHMQKKAAHSTRLHAAFVAANSLIFFILRPFVGGGKIEHAICSECHRGVYFFQSFFKSSTKVQIFSEICKFLAHKKFKSVNFFLDNDKITRF